MFKTRGFAAIYKKYAKFARQIKEKILEKSAENGKSGLKKEVLAEDTYYFQYRQLGRKLQSNAQEEVLLQSERLTGYKKSLFAVEYDLSIKYANFCESLDNRRKEKTNNKNSEEEVLPVVFLKKFSRILASKLRAPTFIGASAVVAPKAEEIIAENVSSSVAEVIPEPPEIPDPAIELASQINALGEPTFASLGLGGWSPVGLVQNCFEYLHVSLGIPWWEAILIGTVVIRMVLFPLVIVAQRNAAKMNNCLPQMQLLQVKMTEARQTGNQLEAARMSQELMLFMKEKGVNPLKNMIVPLAQMPVFVSFFIGLREMANLPVESLRNGGLFWFQDLTVPDQYFAMPIITSLTLFATIELGSEGAKASSQMHMVKWLLRALPVVILPFTVNFPGAILCYWVGSNFISLAQVGFLKIPRVRQFFNIESVVRHKPEHLVIKPKGFTEGIKESWTNFKIAKEVEERNRLNEIRFQKAGRGPIVKTYKYDPTKQPAPQANPNAMNAAKKV